MIRKTLTILSLVALVVAPGLWASFSFSDRRIGLLIGLAICGPLIVSFALIDKREARLRRICESRAPVALKDWIHRYYPMWEDQSELIRVVLDICGEAFGISPSTRLRPTDWLTVNYGWLAPLVVDDVTCVIVEEVYCELEEDFHFEWHPPSEITTLDALITGVVAEAHSPHQPVHAHQQYPPGTS